MDVEAVGKSVLVIASTFRSRALVLAPSPSIKMFTQGAAISAQKLVSVYN